MALTRQLSGSAPCQLSSAPPTPGAPSEAHMGEACEFGALLPADLSGPLHRPNFPPSREPGLSEPHEVPQTQSPGSPQ